MLITILQVIHKKNLKDPTYVNLLIKMYHNMWTTYYLNFYYFYIIIYYRKISMLYVVTFNKTNK